MTDRQDILTECHNMVSHRFHYQSDDKTFGRPDYWMSYAKDVIEGKDFTGDCDDFCMTMVEVLVDHYQIPRSDIRMVICDVEAGRGRHIVCTVDDVDTTIVLDNRYSYIMPWEDLSAYTWIMYAIMDKPNFWIEWPTE